MTQLVSPELQSSRNQARKLVETLPDRLDDANVDLDCREMKSASPSFVDQIIREVLVDRGAAGLTLVRPPESVGSLARRVASTHRVAERLEIISR